MNARRISAVAFVLMFSVLVAGPREAMAFDFFGLFGSREEPVKPSANAIAYEPKIEGTDSSKLKQNINDASVLMRLRRDFPSDGEGLVRRARADISPITDALWGSGYYNGTVSILIDGIDISKGDVAVSQAASRAESARNRAIVPVTIQVTPGTPFTLRDIVVRDFRTRSPFPESQLPESVVRLNEGDPAPTARILAAEVRIVDRLRSLGYPFARVVSRDPVIDHPAYAIDITFVVDPGPKAGLGTVSIKGSSGVDPAVVRSFIYAEPGDPYSPQAVADIRRSVGRIEALGSIRIREGEALDADGNLPLELDIADRPPRLFGFSTRYSTTDGPGIRAYWANRNLFGGGERIRIDGDLVHTSRPDTAPQRKKGFDWSDLGGKVSISFIKPALWGTRNDFLADVVGARETTDGYTSRFVNTTMAVKHRFSDSFSMQGGVEYERGQTSDSLGQVDYTLVGTPVSVTYDSTDNVLDPTRGIRLTASISPYAGFLGSTVSMVVGKAQASTYYALDQDARYIIAGRLGIGSILGPGLDEIPANRRFYAGGGGSVRGYAYRTLSPKGVDDDPIGGRSLLEGSIEGRIKITDTIGVVPFFDFGTAFESSYPDFGESIHYAAGIGLRYYTAIGPIRADLAFPINKRDGDKPVVLYVSLGQAF